MDSTGLAVLDETIPEGPHGDIFGDPSLTLLTCWSDVVFIGRITAYTENLLTTPGIPEWDIPLSDVYDGMVFSVDELLLGDLDSGERPTIAFWALVADEDGSPHSRANVELFSIFRPGVVRRHSEDQPRYLVYGQAARAGGLSDIPGVFHLTHGKHSAALVREDGSLVMGGRRGTVEDARVAARALCVRPPLPPGTREIWRNLTGLSLNMGEALWVSRLTQVCNAALGPDLDRPVWDWEAGLALAEEFVDADGLRPDLPSEWREKYVRGAVTALWIMIVQKAGPDGPSVCWDQVPREFLEKGPPAGPGPAPAVGTGLPPGFDTHMTAEVWAQLEEWADRIFWWVEPPLLPGTREIWWEATELRATIDEDEWAARLNRACNTPLEDPVWDRSRAAVLAEEFIVEDGGEPSPELVEAGADALWRMTTAPQQGVCPWHYPPGTFEPEFVEHMKELRRAALS